MPRPIRGQTSLTTVGLDLVLSIVICWYGGRWLDGRFETGPWLEIIGACIGIAAGFRSVHRGYVQMRALSEREQSEQGNPRPLWGKGAEGEEPAAEPAEPPWQHEPPPAEVEPLAPETPAKERPDDRP